MTSIVQWDPNNVDNFWSEIGPTGPSPKPKWVFKPNEPSWLGPGGENPGAPTGGGVGGYALDGVTYPPNVLTPTTPGAGPVMGPPITGYYGPPPNVNVPPTQQFAGYDSQGFPVHNWGPQSATNGVIQTALPALIPIGGAAIAGFMRLGGFKWLLQTLGPKIAKLVVGAAAFKEFMDLIGVGAPDDSQVKIKTKRGKRRYTIGSNPRVKTLAKVSRHCQRLVKQHQKVLREFEPKTRTRYVGTNKQLLSPAEKKLIEIGGR